MPVDPSQMVLGGAAIAAQEAQLTPEAEKYFTAIGGSVNGPLPGAG
jgi:hypothetical protein